MRGDCGDWRGVDGDCECERDVRTRKRQNFSEKSSSLIDGHRADDVCVFVMKMKSFEDLATS